MLSKTRERAVGDVHPDPKKVTPCIPAQGSYAPDTGNYIPDPSDFHISREANTPDLRELHPRPMGVIHRGPGTGLHQIPLTLMWDKKLVGPGEENTPEAFRALGSLHLGNQTGRLTPGSTDPPRA